MDELERIKLLAGIKPFAGLHTYQPSEQHATAPMKRDFEKANNIQPGTPEWFRLWFAQPHLTGESPFGDKK
jgi:hypothetical protein